MPVNIIDAIVEMQEQEALQITEKRIRGNGDQLKNLDDCSAAVEIVEKRFESGEYFLPQLIIYVRRDLETDFRNPEISYERKANPEIWIGSSSGSPGRHP